MNRRGAKCASCGSPPTFFRPIHRSTCDLTWMCASCREVCKVHGTKIRRGNAAMQLVILFVMLALLAANIVAGQRP